MTTASCTLATALWGARFAGVWLTSCYTTWGDTTTPSSTVDQPVLPALLESVAQTPEMTLAEPKKLSRFDTTQASRAMRIDRIQNTRHPNIRQHAVFRSKNRTKHVLPKTDISCARDRLVSPVLRPKPT